jgi:5-methylcytosine-specific restriction enzyme B
MKYADQVREYAMQHYIVPARAEGEKTVTFTAGEIHTALGFQRRVPGVCDALGSKKFEKEYGIRRLARSGYHGPTATFTFAV